MLEPTINIISAWFKNSGLVANSGKSPFLVSSYEKVTLKILGSTVESSPCEEHLGITVDSDLAFHEHIISLCSKTNQKISTFARIAKYLTIDKRKILLNLFVTAQLNYCALVWMCHSRSMNNKTKPVLGIVCKDYISNFKEFLQRDHPFKIHERNIQYLAIEAYKVKNSLSLVIMNNDFQFDFQEKKKIRLPNMEK